MSVSFPPTPFFLRVTRCTVQPRFCNPRVVVSRVPMHQCASRAGRNRVKPAAQHQPHAVGREASGISTRRARFDRGVTRHTHTRDIPRSTECCNAPAEQGTRLSGPWGLSGPWVSPLGWPRLSIWVRALPRAFESARWSPRPGRTLIRRTSRSTRSPRHERVPDQKPRQSWDQSPTTQNRAARRRLAAVGHWPRLPGTPHRRSWCSNEFLPRWCASAADPPQSPRWCAWC